MLVPFGKWTLLMCVGVEALMNSILRLGLLIGKPKCPSTNWSGIADSLLFGTCISNRYDQENVQVRQKTY